jgi:hypothetical protein
MIAGAEALAAMQAFLDAQAQAQSQPSPSDSKGQPQGQAQPPKAGSTSSAASGAGSSQAGEATENQGLKDDPLKFVETQGRIGDSRTATEKRDTTRRVRRFKEEAWFAKLPPELQRAIRANSKRRAPRAYEERLRRYFESIE